MPEKAFGSRPPRGIISFRTTSSRLPPPPRNRHALACRPLANPHELDYTGPYAVTLCVRSPNALTELALRTLSIGLEGRRCSLDHLCTHARSEQ